jgi:hypothetical protein
MHDHSSEQKQQEQLASSGAPNMEKKVSSRRIEANRRNGRRSTGPKTVAGKRGLRKMRLHTALLVNTWWFKIAMATKARPSLIT